MVVLDALDRVGENGIRPIEDPHDFVRAEISIVPIGVELEAQRAIRCGNNFCRGVSRHLQVIVMCPEIPHADACPLTVLMFGMET